MLLTDFRDAPAPRARYNGTRSYEVASNLGRVNFRHELTKPRAISRQLQFSVT
jgi:hypothetical protein